MPKSHTIQVSIGAALAGSFKSAFKDGSGQLVRLGDGMKKLETKSKNLDRFSKLQTDVKKASSRLADAENTVHNLRSAIQKTDKPTKQMQVNFGRAKAVANKAKEALAKKRLELSKMKRQLGLTSTSSRELASEQVRLGAASDRLRSKYQLLNDSMTKQHKILGKRSDLRNQAFDMLALGAAIAAPVKAAIDFESAMADVRKVVEFKSPKGLEAFGNRLKELSREIPLAAGELASIAASGGQLGIGENELEGFVGVVAKMSTAFDLSAEQAGESIGKIKNVFGIAINDMESFGDTINHLSDNTAAKAKDIVQALLRVGGVAGDFGLKADNVAALADSFIALGKPPEQAGTAINALLVKLNTADKQSAKFQNGLAALGLSAAELKESIGNDAQGALLSFLESVSKLDDQQRAGVLFDLFGQEYVDDISLIAGNLHVYEKALSILSDETKRAGSMQREFTNRSNTTANKMVLFKNRVSDLSISMSQGLLPAVNGVIGVFGQIFTGLASLTKKFPTLTTIVFGTIFGLIALKVAAIGLGYAWTFVAGGANLLGASLIKMRVQMLLSNASFKLFNATALITASRLKLLAFGGMIKAFAGGLLSLATRAIPIAVGALKILRVVMLANPIGLIIGSLAIAGKLVISNWQKVKNFFANFWQPIKPIWHNIVEFIGNIWSAISKPFKAIGALVNKIFGSNGKVEANISTDQLDSSKQAAIIPSLHSNKTSDNKNYNNNFSINIQAAPGQDVKAIADEVMRKLKEQSRGALFDQVVVG